MGHALESQTSEHPLLILGLGRPRSSRTRTRLLAAAERSGITVATLGRRDPLQSLERMLSCTQADALAVCADACTQALVASVAATRNLPYSCVPAGDDDLLARDLGNLPDDPAETLLLLRSGCERAVDLAEVNGAVFVNYVAVGLGPPRSGAAGGGWRAERVGAGGTAPAAGPWAAQSLLVTNNRFAVCADGLGERDWPDRGVLGVIAFGNGDEQPREEPRCAHLELPAVEPVLAEVDGEPRLLQPPLRFRSLPRALRVRVRAHRRATGAQPRRLRPT
jgi:hypothetical protein